MEKESFWTSFVFGELELPFVEVDDSRWFVFGGSSHCGELFGIKDIHNKCKTVKMEEMFPGGHEVSYRHIELEGEVEAVHKGLV